MIIVKSIVAKGPLVFLSLNQELSGSFDGILSLMNANFEGSWSYAESNTGFYVNYTHAYELYGDDLNLSPRNSFHSIYLFKNQTEEIAQESSK